MDGAEHGRTARSASGRRDQVEPRGARRAAGPTRTSTARPRSSRPGPGSPDHCAAPPRSATEAPRRAVRDVRVGEQHERGRLLLDEPLQADPGRAGQAARLGGLAGQVEHDRSNSPEPSSVPAPTRAAEAGCGGQPPRSQNRREGPGRRPRRRSGSKRSAGSTQAASAPAGSACATRTRRPRSDPKKRGRTARTPARVAARRRSARRACSGRWTAAAAAGPLRAAAAPSARSRRWRRRSSSAALTVAGEAMASLFFRHDPSAAADVKGGLCAKSQRRVLSGKMSRSRNASNPSSARRRTAAHSALCRTGPPPGPCA